MKRIILTFIPLLFIIMTSMSDCEDKEGLLTKVKGRVEDISTKEGYENIVLQVKRESGSFSKSPIYREFDTVKTDVYGNYELEFIPKGIGRFYISYKDYDFRDRNLMMEYSGNSNELVEGKENVVNFKLSKLVNLTVRLSNSSNFGFSDYRLSANCCLNFETSNQNITRDTTLFYKVPRLKNIILTSSFHNNYKDRIVKD